MIAFIRKGNHFSTTKMPLKFDYFASQEQYSPSQLLEHVVLAERLSFDSVWISDHFHPWVHSMGNSSFAWVLLAAAAERTTRMRVGTGITAPIFRYHPAIVAQAFATLGVIYPNRVFLGVGTGEALNEIPVGFKWPTYRERAARFEEAVRIIKLLWTNQFVNFKGRYYELKKANLYTKPKAPIPLYIAASGKTAAELAGKYADGLLTTILPPDRYRNVLFPAVEEGARAVNRDPSSVERVLEFMVSYDEDYDKALASCRMWAALALPIFFKYGIYDPREIEECGKLVGDKGLSTVFFISSELDEHIRKIEEYVKLGFRRIYIQSSSPNEEKFIETYGRKVLPYLRESHTE